MVRDMGRSEQVRIQSVIASDQKEHGNRTTTQPVIARNRKEYGNRITTTLVIASRAQPDEAIAFLIWGGESTLLNTPPKNLLKAFKKFIVFLVFYLSFFGGKLERGSLSPF